MKGSRSCGGEWPWTILDCAFEMTFRAVDADKAKAMMKDLKGEIAEYARQVRDQPDNFTHTAPLMVDAMEACKIMAAGDLVTLKGSVTPEVIASFLRQAGPSPNLAAASEQGQVKPRPSKPRPSCS